jgi:hypothetical protein
LNQSDQLVTTNGWTATYLTVVAIVLAIFFCGLVVEQIRDLEFYRLNRWDFTLDSGVNSNYYPGESGTKASNKTRVFFVRPFFIVVVRCLAAAAAFGAVAPQIRVGP